MKQSICYYPDVDYSPVTARPQVLLSEPLLLKINHRLLTNQHSELSSAVV